MAARRRGEDIIDFGMGNPDGPTPQHIVDKLIETVAAPRHARLLGVEGHPAAAPRDLPLVPARYGVELDPDTEAIVTIGSKEGIAHLALATLGPRRHRARAEPELPDPHLRAGDRGRRHPPRADDAGRRFLRGARAGDPRDAIPKPKMLIVNFPSQPDRAVRRARRSSSGSSRSRASTTSTSCTTSPTPTSCSTAARRRRSCRCRARATSRSSSSRCRRATTWPAGASASWSATASWSHALARIKSYHDYGTFTPIQVAAIVALEGPQDCVAEIARASTRSAATCWCEGLHEAGWMVDDAEGVDVRLGEDSRARTARWARSSSRRSCCAKAKVVGVAGHRLRRVRRRPRALRDDRERGAHAPGGARHQGDVPRGRTAAVRAWRSVAMKPMQRRACSASAPSAAARGTCCARNEEEIARRAGPADPHQRGSRDADARAVRATRRAASPASTSRATRRPCVADPDIDIVVELIGGTSRARTLILRGDRERQARRHREQGAARAARQRDLRRGAREGRDGRVRRRGRRRHPDHQGAARGAHREPHRVDRRHHQRHVATSSCPRCATRARRFDDVLAGGAAARLRRGRPDVRHRGHRRRAQAHDHGGDRVRHPDAVRRRSTPKASRSSRGEDIRYAEELGYRIKLLGIARRTPDGHRAARASDAHSRRGA